jgi:hypothetical protein
MIFLKRTSKKAIFQLKNEEFFSSKRIISFVAQQFDLAIQLFHLAIQFFDLTTQFKKFNHTIF